jgi:DNA polymerase-3 subunit epsilon/ATP-dependent DNA helicase DinG
LRECSAVRLGSPFDFARAALLYVPHDVPEPGQPGHQSALEEVVSDVAMRLGGRTLVLFTSHAQLGATYRALRGRLAEAGIAVLAQGQAGLSRGMLLDRFRRGERSVLLGTASFWEGVDVVGEALSCLIIAKLPFAVPTDPVFEARAEQFDDSFGEYAVPQAILRLKQGFGRLIRSRDDRGVMIMLDRRLYTKGYGRRFLRSLPDCAVLRGPAADAGRVTVQFLGTAGPAQRAGGEPLHALG